MRTVKVQPPQDATGFKVPRGVLSAGHGNTQVDRSFDEMESPFEVRRNNDKQKAVCIMHMVRIVRYKSIYIRDG